MSKKKIINQSKEAAATAKFVTADVKVADAIHETFKASGVVKQHPEYATRPAMQSSVGDWENAANNLGDIQQKIGSEEGELNAVEATHGVTIASWRRATEMVLAIINALAGGSAKALAEWGFEVETRTPAPPETSAPPNLRARFSNKDLSLTLRWKAIRGHRGYLLQIGDTANPIAWGQVIPVPDPHYQPVGLAPGQRISVRVAVQRKTGVSPWSDVLVVTVR